MAHTHGKQAASKRRCDSKSVGGRSRVEVLPSVFLCQYFVRNIGGEICSKALLVFNKPDKRAIYLIRNGTGRAE